jgi:hypothetical protein
VLLATGAGATGIVYLNKNAEGRRAAPDGDQRRDAAKLVGTINMGLWAAAAAGAGITTYLYVTRPEREPRARLSPWLATNLAGLSLAGAF